MKSNNSHSHPHTIHINKPIKISFHSGLISVQPEHYLFFWLVLLGCFVLRWKRDNEFISPPGFCQTSAVFCQLNIKDYSHVPTIPEWKTVTATLAHTTLCQADSYLEREPRLATVGWQAGHSHSPAGMRYRAGRRQNRWKALLHSSQRISFSSSPGSDENKL